MCRTTSSSFSRHATGSSMCRITIPTIVYGRWWWPDRQPYYWEPPPRYRPPGYSIASGIFFGVSVGIVNSIFHPVRPDWHQHHLIIIGGNKPGGHWQWKPRPPRPGHPKSAGTAEPSTDDKPILKPQAAASASRQAGWPADSAASSGPTRQAWRPEIQPPRPGIPGKPGGPAIQPPRPGRPEGPPAAPATGEAGDIAR